MPNTVLVVDDDTQARTEMLDVLQGEGVGAVGAADTDSALRLVDEDEAISVVVSDIDLRTSSGLDLLSALKNDRNGDHEVIMITGTSGIAQAIEALRLGAHDFILKPIDLKHLVRVVDRASDQIKRSKAARVAEQALEGYTDILRSTNEELKLRNQLIRNLLDRYVDNEVVRTLLQTPESTGMGGERQKVTILIGDIRSFTRLSEARDAEEVVDLLNNYLGEMIDVIAGYGGTIDNIVGDSIIATFGAPVQRGDDADRAVACAIDMQLHMMNVNDRNRAAELPEIQMGIGIDTGHVIVGNLGTDRRAKYSVIGRPVNRASRIESHAVRGQILISHATLAEVDSTLKIDGSLMIQPKGIDHPVEIHQVRGIEAPYNMSLPVV